MLVNYILNLCVRIGRHACIRDENTMKKHKNSGLGKIEFEHLKIRSCLSFEQSIWNAKL